MVVFMCNDEIESIWSAIYDAGISKISIDSLKIEIGIQNQQLFVEYRQVETAGWKIDKVMESIEKYLSRKIYDYVTLAALSQDQLRADKIYRFLHLAFRSKIELISQLQVKEVKDIYDMNLNYNRELHRMQGFVRFSSLGNGILYGKICPKNDLLPILSYHFVDRMSQEHWILHDEKRNKAVVFHKEQGIVVVRSKDENWLEELSKQVDNCKYDQLWKIFHQSISIKERENKNLQKSFVPIYYRDNMIEWQT